MEDNTSTAEYILAQYLGKYSPADDNDTHVLVKTTQDIIDELAEVVDLEINAVADVLHAEGYKIIHGKDGRLGWALKPRNKTP